MLDQPAKPRRTRVRRWAIRLFVGFVLLVLILLITLQIIFWTAVPRNLVINVVQQALGLRVTAATLSTGFFGHTTLSNVTLALPLADESFFKVDELKVSHTSIPALLFKRSVEVQSVELNKARIVVRQDSAGKWNLQEVATLIARAAGSGNPQQESRPSTTLKVPNVDIVDASILIVANNGQQAELRPLNVHGESENTLTWKYDVTIGEQLKAVGRVAPGGDFPHEVDLQMKDVDQWIALVAPGFKHDIRVDGTWRGQLAGGHLSGRLDLKEARYDALSAKGPISVFAGDTIEARPESLVLSTGQPALPEVTVVGGVLKSNATALTAERVQLALAGGTASISGQFEPATRRFQGGALWQDVSIAGAASISGSADLSVTEPLKGRPRFTGKVATTGRSGDANWDAALSIDGNGQSYDDVDWSISADKMLLSLGHRKADLIHSVARVSTKGDHFVLQSLKRPDATALSAFGEYDIGDAQWYFWMNGKGPQLPGGDQQPLTFMLDAWGKDRFVQLNQLYLRDTELEISGNGYYIGTEPDPIFLNLSLSQVSSNSPLAIATEKPLVGGHVLGDFYIHGRLRPSDVYLQGWLTGKDVVVADRTVGDLKIALDGSIDRERRLRMKTQELSLFDGKWSIEAESPTPWDSTLIIATVHDLPLASVGKAAGTEAVGGMFNGQWTINATSFRPADLRISGSFDAKDLRGGPFVADTLTGRTWLRNGSLKNEINLRQANGDAKLNLATSLDNLKQLHLTADVNNWPLAAGTAKSVTSVDADLQIDLKAKGATGSATIAGSAFLNDKQVGDANVTLASRGRIIEVQHSDARLLGGTAEGNAIFDLDHPLAAVARGSWSNIDSAQLVEFVPRATGLTGTYSGLIAIAPDTRPRPLAPLAATVIVTPHNAMYKAIDIGGLNASLAVDYDETWRLVADEIKLKLDGGDVDIWARATQHATDDPILRRAGRANLLATQATVRFKGLNLDPIMKSAKPGGRPMNAKLAGEFNLFADSSDIRGLVGTATVDITDGNLANFKPTEAVFKQLNVGTDGGAKSAGGYGSILARIERGRLDLNNVTYYERAVEMRSVATIYDIYEDKESPIKGWIVGTLRPFKDTKIPFLADADEILSVLQSQAATFQLGGTLQNLTVQQTTLAEVGDSLKQLITGDVRSQTTK